MVSQIKIYLLAVIGLIISGLMIALKLKGGKVETLKAKVEVEKAKTKQVSEIVTELKKNEELRNDIAEVVKTNDALDRDQLRDKLRKYTRN